VTSSVVAALLLAITACTSASTNFPRIDPADLSDDITVTQANVVEASLERYDRLNRIAWPLLTANAELCHDRQREAYGITFGNDETIRGLVDGLSLEQVQAIGYDQTIRVIGVSGGSPAFDAGLIRGAVPIKIGETVVDGQMEALETALRKDKTARAVAAKTELNANPLPMVFEQDGQRFEIALQPETICDVRLRLSETDTINASAGRRVIKINRGIMTYLSDDRDLSIVIAHELGHVAGKHVPKLTRNHWVSGRAIWGLPVRLGAGLFDLGFGGLFERFGDRETPPGRGAVSRLNNRALGLRDFEREADYLAVYFAARAGVDLDGFEALFMRLSELSARSTYGERSHPITSERKLALQLARDEVNRKREAGAPLVPEGWPFPLAD